MFFALCVSVFPFHTSQIFTCTCLAISLRQFRLNSHSDHAGLGNDLFLVGLVNVAGQSGDEQGGQDGQDDQNDDQLDEGEALFVFQFF